MSEDYSDPQEGMRSRGSDAVGDLTNALLDNPLLQQALSTALGVGERATQAQRRAMDAVGLPSADELGRLERRVRSLSDRLESTEDQLDQLVGEVSSLRAEIAERDAAVAAAEAETVAADQSSLDVSEAD